MTLVEPIYIGKIFIFVNCAFVFYSHIAKTLEYFMLSYLNLLLIRNCIVIIFVRIGVLYLSFAGPVWLRHFFLNIILFHLGTTILIILNCIFIAEYVIWNRFIFPLGWRITLLLNLFGHRTDDQWLADQAVGFLSCGHVWHDVVSSSSTWIDISLRNLMLFISKHFLSLFENWFRSIFLRLFRKQALALI